MDREKVAELIVLVVDDDPLQNRLVCMAMETAGYRVESAGSVQECLEKMKNHLPDIIVLDMQLPDGTGLDVLDSVKLIPKADSTKIIVFSSGENNDIVLESLSRGAIDYAFKKDDIRILEARVFNIARSILLNKALNQVVQTMEESMIFAREIQLSTVPSSKQFAQGNLQFGVLYLPLEFVSGDIYDIHKISETRYRVFLADATGHGIQAGFITISIKTEYDRLKKQHESIEPLLLELNDSIRTTFSDLTLYTCIVVDIDLDRKELTYSSCGHPAQLLFQGGKVIELSATNTLIGAMEKPVIHSQTLALGTDFRLCLFSDGIYEFFNNEGEFFGLEKFEELLESLKHHDPQNLSFELMSALFKFMDAKGFTDDVTLVSVAPNPSHAQST